MFDIVPDTVRACICIYILDPLLIITPFGSLYVYIDVLIQLDTQGAPTSEVNTIPYGLSSSSISYKYILVPVGALSISSILRLNIFLITVL